MKNASFSFLFCILLFFLLILLTEKPAQEKKPAPVLSKEITVYHPDTDTTEKMPIDQYICYCLAGEMPASFHSEALKAQAVAIRSYISYKAQSASHPKNADVCTDFNHCAAFSEIFDTFPEKTKEIYQNTVSATSAEVLYYENQPANTVFHAMSGGKTESAENVWGASVPYLISVDSFPDTESEKFETVVSFSYAEIMQKLETTSCTLGTIKHNEGGTVKNIVIGEKTFTGREIREKLSLRSAYFTVSDSGEALVFTVHGYGHGVGMSQEGANSYAKQGLSYVEILEKYYPGTTLCRLY